MTDLVEVTENQDEPELSAVPKLAIVLVDDEGNFQVRNQGLQDTQLPTLFRLAAKNIEQRLGL